MLDTLLSGQLLFAALATGATYALVAVGLNLVYGTMRLLNIAHGDVAMLGGYATFWGFSLLGLSPLIGIVLVALFGAALGVLAYRGLFRRLLGARRPVAQLESNSLLVFFGLSIIAQNLTALTFSASAQGYQFLPDVLRFGSVAITQNRLLAMAVALLVCLAIVVYLRFSVAGLAMRALIEHRDAAAVVGVDVERVQWMSFAIGFATAAIAGALVSMTEQVSPFMGFPLTIAAFIVVILGGLGNVLGGMIAALLLGLIEVYGVALTSATYRSILLYGLFVVILLFRPQGLLGRCLLYTSPSPRD